MALEYWCVWGGHWKDDVKVRPGYVTGCRECWERMKSEVGSMTFEEGQSIVREKRKPRFKVRGGATRAEVLDIQTHGYGIATFYQPSHLKIDVLPFAEKYCEELNKAVDDEA